MDAIIINGFHTESQKNVKAKILRERAIEPYNVSILSLPEGQSAIGIKETRAFLRTLHISSFGSGGKAAVIEKAELMTVEAQHSLLKTLEEPPPHTFILLETQNYERLLPTIISRCQLLTSPIIGVTPNKQSVPLTADELVGLTPGTIRSRVDSAITSPQEAQVCIEQALIKIHEEFMNPDTSRDTLYQRATLGRALLRAVNQLSHNVSYKLILDHLGAHGKNQNKWLLNS